MGKASLYLLPVAACLLAACATYSQSGRQEQPALPAKWKHGLPSDRNYFPIAVWLQSPANAAKYKALGINLYVGLWKGPTEEQLKVLKEAGMPVICDMNEEGLRHIATEKEPIIVGWMHGDEPDNAQSDGKGGYGPPILPSVIVEDYRKMVAKDPTRPVMLNLGQGVAWDNWHGRGVRTNHPEDYPEYIKGGDIISFDIYPVAHSSKEVRNNLWYVAQGVERLVKWSEGKKIIWNCLECTHISSDQKATPKQMRAEAWMAVIKGSRGFIWFVHEFKPQFKEAAILSDAVNSAAVASINKEVSSLAAAINSPDVPVSVSVTNEAVPVAAVMKEEGGTKYIFAVGMRQGETQASFSVPAGTSTVEVINESRSIAVKNGSFTDTFADYDVHLYRLK